MKGVFEISGNTPYGDTINERYHFPSNYLSVARELVSDWIVYRETRVSGGRMAYIAAAFVERIEGSYSNVVGLPLHRVVEVLLRTEAIEGFPL